MYANLPELGVGLGWRLEIAADIHRYREEIDWCEIISEQYINATSDKLDQARRLAAMLPVIPHGVDLSIGTDLPVEESYLDGLKALVEAVDAPWFTDHLCFTRAPGFKIGQLTPLAFTDEAVDIVVRKARAVKERIGRPFLLENITYHFVVGGGMPEAEFITRVMEEADIGMLLDVCNLHVNAANHGYDPYAFLDSIPLERVVQLHIAGGIRERSRLLDTHSHPVPNEVFELVDSILARAPVKGILLERDQNFPSSFTELVEELRHARALFHKHRPAEIAV